MDWSSMSINQIRDTLDKALLSEKKNIIDELVSDGRAGVRNMANKLMRELENEERETQRIIGMKEYEYKCIEKGAKYIAGIDEVGRGPLAGPVYASAVMFPAEVIIKGVNDSKKLSPKKRKELYEEIKEKAIGCATGCCDEKTIDSINILNATYEAMKQAISKLPVKPQVLLIDAVRIPGIGIFQIPIVKGDSLSFSIAAASIIAKVERDSFMDNMHEKYPVYNFISNKGYGTREHMDALKKYGPCPIHRKKFIEGII